MTLKNEKAATRITKTIINEIKELQIEKIISHSISGVIEKNSPILILDEATVYIDPEDEKLVQEAINKLI